MFGLSPTMIQKTAACPFMLGGSWEGDLEGWVTEGWMVNLNYPEFARTGDYTIAGASGAGSATFTLSGSQTAGLTLVFSVWHRAASSNGVYRRILYKIGSGSFTLLDSVEDTSPTYAQLSGTFDNSTGEDVTLRIEGGFNSFFDDWVISGS